MSVAAPLTLYVDAFWLSPFDAACFVAMREKNLAFTTSMAMVQEGLGQAQHLAPRAFVGQVPVLQHGDFWLSESMAIVEYLDEAFPAPAFPSVMPRDLLARARARQLMLWTRTGLGDLRRARPTILLFYDVDRLGMRIDPLDAAAAKDAAVLLDVTERLLAASRSAWLFDEFGAADFDLALALMRLVRAGHAVPESVRTYAERVWDRPSVRAFVERPRPPYPPR